LIPIVKSVKLNITVKLIGYLVVVSVLPLLAFALSCYDFVRDSMTGVARSYSEQLVVDQSEYLEQQMQQVESLSARIASTEEIGDAAVKADAAGAKNPYDDLSTQVEIRRNLNVFGNLTGVVSIDLFTAGGHRFYVGDTLTVSNANEQARLRMYQAGLGATRPILWLGVEDNLNTASPVRKVLTAVKIMQRYSDEKRNSVPIGMLVVDYSPSVLAEHFRIADLGANSYLLVSDENGRIVYAPDATRIGQPLPVELAKLPRSRRGDAKVNLSGDSAFVSFACLSKTSWCTYGIIPEATLMAPMRRLANVLLIIIASCLGVITLAGYSFRRNVVKPIQLISNGFMRIQRHGAADVAPLRVLATNDEIGELVAWFNSFLDNLHLRDTYEEKLRDSEQKFANIFHVTPSPLCLMRMDTGIFVDVNISWLTQFGFTRDEVIGHTTIDLQIWVDLADRAKVLDAIKQTQLLESLEVPNRTKDGRILTTLISGRPLELRGERLFIFSNVDVTHQRQVEQEIRDINQELEMRVRSRTVNLEHANAELAKAMDTLMRTKSELVRSEKLAALGSLVAGIAHELNTPIGNAVTVNSTLEDQTLHVQRSLQLGNLRRSAISEYLDNMVSGTNLMTRNLDIARDLVVNFKQVAADQASNQRRRFDLRETLESIIATVTPMFKKTGHTLLCELQDDILMDSYPGPLGQVVTNFVSNAMTHAFEGREGGRMILRTYKIDKTHVEISFADNGTGIEDRNLGRVFDPFFTTKMGKGGSGLGLNIVYNIVTGVLGGKIHLESSLGVGTTFVMRLPLTAPDLGAKDATAYLEDWKV
jgi:PAS domain S-box-containing protein